MAKRPMTTSGLTPAIRLVEATRYMEQWAPRLGILPSTVEVMLNPQMEEDVGAQLLPYPQFHRYVLQITPMEIAGSAESWGYPDERTRLEADVVHELCHVAEFPKADEMTRHLVDLLGERGFIGHHIRRAWEEYREWWVNRIVRALLELAHPIGSRTVPGKEPPEGSKRAEQGA